MASMHGIKRRLRALGATALVVGLLVGPLAAAGQSAELSEYAGSGSGFGLRTVVDLSVLPAAARDAVQDAYATFRDALDPDVQALLPEEFSFVMDQRFIETLATIGQSTKATAILGSGVLGDDAITATAVGESKSYDASERLLNNAGNAVDQDLSNLPLVDISAGKLLASVASGPKVDASGTLASVAVSLDALADIFEAVPELAALFTQIQDAITDAVNTANAELDGALAEVGTTLSETCDDAVGEVGGTPLGGTVGDILDEAGIDCTDVTDVTDTLQSLVQLPDASDLLASNIASITGVDTDSASQKTADGVVKSDAASKLAGINVLDMLRVGVVDIASHSEAAGVAGSATNTSSCEIASVKFGDEDNGVSFDGETLYVNGQAVPVVGDALATIKDQIDAVTSVLGLSVDLCDEVVKSAAADGTSASQTVSALRVELAPEAPVDVAALGITAGDPIFRVLVDPSVETVASAQVATTTTEPPTLPRTGPAALVTIVTGLGIAGGAMFLRRRLA